MSSAPPVYSSNLSLARIQFEQYFFQQLPADQYQPLLSFFELPGMITYDQFFPRIRQRGYNDSLAKLHEFLVVTHHTALDNELIKIANRCGINLSPAPAKPIETPQPCSQPQTIAISTPVTALEDESLIPSPILPSYRPPLPSAVLSAALPQNAKPSYVSHRPVLTQEQEFDSIQDEIRLKLVNLSSLLAFFSLPYTVSSIDTAFNMLKDKGKWDKTHVYELNVYLKAVQFDPEVTARIDAYHTRYCHTVNHR